MLVPGTSLLVGGGKTGLLYVLNTSGSGLGKETTNNSGAIQAIHDFRRRSCAVARCTGNVPALTADRCCITGA